MTPKSSPPEIISDGNPGSPMTVIQPLPDGRTLVGRGFLGGPAYVTLHAAETVRMVGGWRYPDFPGAFAAVVAWDGEGEPSGWDYHFQSRRWRKGGDQWLEKREAMTLFKPLADGRFVTVRCSTEGPSVAALHDPAGAVADSWVYASLHPFDAMAGSAASVMAWSGVGEPYGWVWHPKSGRRRPTGQERYEYLEPARPTAAPPLPRPKRILRLFTA